MRKKNLILIILLVLLVVSVPLFFIFKDRIIQYIPIFSKNNNTSDEVKKEITRSAKGVEYRLTKPILNGEVDCYFEIEGEVPGSWFFEGVFPIKLVSSTGVLIQTVQAKAQGDTLSEDFVKFDASISCTNNCSGKAKLVFEKDNPSDLVENDDSFEIPITFRTLCDIDSVMTLKVYFGSKEKDPNAENCQKVYAVNRKVIKTEGVGRAALMELLAGVNSTEVQAGYFSSIPSGVTLNSLKIQNGKAYVDFDEKLQEGVGGSCLTDTIRAQITQTLLQFPTVKKVIISINGDSKTILQP